MRLVTLRQYVYVQTANFLHLIFPVAAVHNLGKWIYIYIYIPSLDLNNLLKAKRSKSTGLFVSPSGISELDCATTKTDTAERSIPIGR